MPTRISAGVGDHPFSLLFKTMIPIDYKNCIFFPFICLFVDFWEITTIISKHAPNKLLVEKPLYSMLHVHSFSARYAVL